MKAPEIHLHHQRDDRLYCCDCMSAAFLAGVYVVSAATIIIAIAAVFPGSIVPKPRPVAITQQIDMNKPTFERCPHIHIDADREWIVFANYNAPHKGPILFTWEFKQVNSLADWSSIKSPEVIALKPSHYYTLMTKGVLDHVLFVYVGDERCYANLPVWLSYVHGKRFPHANHF